MCFDIICRWLSILTDLANDFVMSRELKFLFYSRLNFCIYFFIKYLNQRSNNYIFTFFFTFLFEKYESINNNINIMKYKIIFCWRKYEFIM